MQMSDIYVSIYGYLLTQINFLVPGKQKEIYSQKHWFKFKEVTRDIVDNSVRTFVIFLMVLVPETKR